MFMYTDVPRREFMFLCQSNNAIALYSIVCAICVDVAVRLPDDADSGSILRPNLYG